VVGPATLALGALLAACTAADDPGPEELPELPWARAHLPPPPEPADNPTSEAKVHLGWLLFHDPILSSDEQVACVTCHGMIWGFGDGLPLGVGVGGEGPAGTGRTGPNHTRRNSQTLWNVAYQEELFWDGRAASLEAQIYGPIENPVEMDRDPAELIADLRAIPEYETLFAAAFPARTEPIDETTLGQALAAFERTLISDRAPYDRYALEGDAGALSELAIRGMWLFASTGCVDCHTPPLFGSNRYGAAHAGASGDDLGRFEVTGDDADRARFRTPVLRNVRDTGPYFFDGSEPSLAMAVQHAPSRPLTADEVEAIVEFLRKGLTDEAAAPPRALTVPSGLPVPLDGYSVPR
jgi:cytochrome c peroxidase